MKFTLAAASLALLVGSIGGTTATTAAEPTPAVTIRAVGPDRQAEAVIGLFRGARAAHPAAALAAWKRASREPGRLGKPLEAAIAAINPRMAGELRSLEGAEVSLWFEPEGGKLAWGITLPNDDGTFAALAPALALSGGAAEPPIDGRAVDRLGGPGSALMLRARGPGGLAIAGSREGLRFVGGRPRPPEGDRRGVPASGWLARVDPAGLAGSPSIAVRRLAEAIRALGCREVSVSAGLEDAKLSAIASGSFVADPGGHAEVDPAWVDWIPADRPMAAIAAAIDPRPEAWEAAFALADRVERVDPARAGLAPIRLRLDLAARAAGVRTEVDVLPHLRGVSGWVGSDGRGIDAALVALHLGDEGAAIRLVTRARPSTLAGRALRLDRRGATVLIAWGEGVLERSVEAKGRPDRSAGPAIRARWAGPPPDRAGAVWPARVPGIVPGGSPLATALGSAPPILWAGQRSGDLVADAISWHGLDALVRRFLDLIPLDPPPDR